jgi:hypothetical protein
MEDKGNTVKQELLQMMKGKLNSTHLPTVHPHSTEENSRNTFLVYLAISAYF